MPELKRDSAAKAQNKKFKDKKEDWKGSMIQELNSLSTGNKDDIQNVKIALEKSSVRRR